MERQGEACAQAIEDMRGDVLEALDRADGRTEAELSVELDIGIHTPLYGRLSYVLKLLKREHVIEQRGTARVGNPYFVLPDSGWRRPLAKPLAWPPPSIPRQRLSVMAYCIFVLTFTGRT